MSVDDTKNDPYGILATITPEKIVLAAVEDLDTYHVISGMMWTFYLTIDGVSIAISGLKNNFIVKAELHAVVRALNSASFVITEYEAEVAIVTGDIDKFIDAI